LPGGAIRLNHWLRAAAAAGVSPLASVRVVVWSWSQGRSLKRSLHKDGMDAITRIRPSPGVDGRHRLTVAGVMRLMGATCLVRSAMLQRWDADHGRDRPLVIGVSRDGDAGVLAHAWLEGERRGSFEELLRRRPPRVTGGPGAGDAVS